MTEIVGQYPLCAKNNNKLFDQRAFRGERVANRLCLTCGLVFQSPRMTEDELETFYEREYRQLYQGSEGLIRKLGNGFGQLPGIVTQEMLS